MSDLYKKNLSKSMKKLSFAMLCAMMWVQPASANVKSAPVDPSKPIDSLKNLTSITQTNDVKTKTPDIESFTTTKGTRVLFVRATELPIVDIRITFNAGSARDADISKQLKTPLQGTSAITAAMLFKGIKDAQGNVRSENDIASTIENLGVNLSSKAYKDMFVVSLRALSSDKYLAPATSLLHDVLSQSSFPADALARVKAQTLIGLKQANERPNVIAKNTFFKSLYGTHPYALPSTGTVNTVPNISRDALIAFRSKFLVAKNASIAITGDLTLEKVKALAEKITENLPLGAAASPLEKPKKPKSKHIHIPFESNQTTIVAGQLGIDRTDMRLFDLNVANDIFGGGEFHAKLMHELREKRGLTYGAYSVFSPMQVTGPFSLSFSTRNDKAKQALKVTKRTLRKYLRKGATQAEINDTKTSMINKFPLGLATNASINGWLGMMAFYNLPTDFMENYTLNIAAVTKHSVNTAFQEKISSRNMVIVSVGPKKPK